MTLSGVVEAGAPEPWSAHVAIVERPESRVDLAARLVHDTVSSGERVLLVHGGGLEGAGLTVMLEERGVVQGGAVELLHRSAFPSAATEAARRSRAASPGPLQVVVLDDGRHGRGCVPCQRWNHLGEPASLTCVFDAQAATLHCLKRLLGHDRVALEGTTTHDLGSPADALVVVGFLWELLRRDEELSLAVRAATAAGLPRDLVELLARRRRAHVSDRRATAAARGELTRMRRRAERTEEQLAAREAIRRSLGDADGDLDALLEVSAKSTGALVLLEDPSFRLLRWAGGTPRAASDAEPRPLADVLTPGRLHRLAAELQPGVMSSVPLGAPAAGARLIMRLGQRTLGYLSLEGWSAIGADEGGLWLSQLEGPLVAGLRLERARASLAADLRTHIVGLLASGTLSPADATAAAEHAGWHRARAARMAAVLSLPTTPVAESADAREAACRRLQAAGFAAAVHGGYVAVLLGPDGHELERLRATLDGFGAVAVGLGSTITDAAAAARSFREAAWAARMAAVSAKRFLHVDDLGVHRLLMPGAEAGDPVLEAPIERLEGAGGAFGFDPIETLTVYLDSGASPAEAARRLHVHVNSVRYRLERLAEIGELDLADPEQRFRLQLALRIRASRRFLRSQSP